MNSIESMPDGGTIRIQAKNVEITEKSNLPVSEGKYIEISIKDDGVGVAEEHLSRIFDPYFTTKQMGTRRGLGLGLSIAYSIVAKHQGYISVESKVGVGSNFKIFLLAYNQINDELQ